MTLDGSAPAYRIAAEVRMLPAGVLPMNGWLFILVSVYTLYTIVQLEKGPNDYFLDGH